MALAVLSLPHLLGPLQSLWAWVSQPQAAPSPQTAPRPAIQRSASPGQHVRRAAAPSPMAGLAGMAGRANMPRVVRVVRVAEPSQARGGAGRMVISGRMADVCAELDRLAAREAQLHQSPR